MTSSSFAFYVKLLTFSSVRLRILSWKSYSAGCDVFMRRFLRSYAMRTFETSLSLLRVIYCLNTTIWRSCSDAQRDDGDERCIFVPFQVYLLCAAPNSVCQSSHCCLPMSFLVKNRDRRSTWHK